MSFVTFGDYLLSPSIMVWRFTQFVCTKSLILYIVKYILSYTHCYLNHSPIVGQCVFNAFLNFGGMAQTQIHSGFTLALFSGFILGRAHWIIGGTRDLTWGCHMQGKYHISCIPRDFLLLHVFVRYVAYNMYYLSLQLIFSSLHTAFHIATF